MLLVAAFTAAWIGFVPESQARAPVSAGTQTLMGAGVDTTTLTIVSNTPRQTHELVDGGLLVTIEPGKKATPTLFIRPAEGVWDLSSYGHIIANVTNLDKEKPLRMHMRVDNAGPWQNKPWNTEIIRVLPGKTQPVKVIFGHHHGFNPGFKLDPSKVTKVALFIEHPEEKYSYRVESVVAGGPAGEVPKVKAERVRVKPENGVILDAETRIGQTLKLTARGGTAQATEGGVALEFSGKAENAAAAIRPREGRWNLNEHLQVAVTLTNTGDSPVTPQVWLDSNKAPGDKVSFAEPIAPGEQATVVVPFMGQTLWEGPADATKKPAYGTGGTRFASNTTSAVFIAPDVQSPVSLRVDRIEAGMPPRQPMPDWVGKRPPVQGDWSLTFEENFDKPIDPEVWNIYTSNFWDKRSHFSKDNVIVGDGVVKLRFEKKTGHHNDDPSRKVTDYATGFLDTYGKWVQTYGYFEARMKLPDAPGMWPAFWTMPDRGVEAGPQWKRASIADGGMELDIMEYLSRWGPNRFTTAFHWDGYRKNHKATGNTTYFMPDEDGFVTVGILWLPGSVTVYTNGVPTSGWTNPRICSVRSYIKFTAVSGGWDNDPIDDSQLPADFVIDYVRVWQRADLKLETDGPQAP
ncbi:MAG: glycoside hydrolase family 16 protein [Planctomycetota bacterium]